MRHGKLAFLFFIGFVLGVGLFAQQQGRAAFSPYVSALRVEIRGNLLRLSWQDSADARGSVFIYRSLSPFEEGMDALEGRPVEIPYGAQSYIDEFDNPGTYYYFVAASDGENRYIEFFPGNTVAIVISEAVAIPDLPGPAPIPAPFIQRVTAQGISDLTAKVDNGSVVITFNYEREGNLILYRGLRPIARTADLLSAIIIRRDAISPFIDNPVPGIPYYYALVPAEELLHGTAALLPGVNTTVAPIEAPAVGSSAADSGIRSVPLPLVSLSAAVTEASGFVDTPRIAELSREAEAAIENFPAHQRNPVPLKNSNVFLQDIRTVEGGEDYLLSVIVRGPFEGGDWRTAQDELLRFLSMPRSRASEARARYYLGQCYYFSHELREALFEFLQARTVYPDETAEWIQACLSMMVE